MSNRRMLAINSYDLHAMPYNEADTRAKLIDPSLRKVGWREEWISREKTAGTVQLSAAGAKRARKRVDYVLSIPLGAEMLPIALIEAKAEDQNPASGLEQVKEYRRRWNVPFVYSSNGHRFVEYDHLSGQTCDPKPMQEFPNWQRLADRYCKHHSLLPGSQIRRALRLKPVRGDRYYQRAAVRAVLEHFAAGHNRALLSLATGTGKTRIAVNLLRALADTRQLRRALFLCDRDELRTQALGALSQSFGPDAAAAKSANPEKNARVVVATYQTMGVDKDGNCSYLNRHYPEHYFSHIVVDEAHRSGWGKWRQVLDRNPNSFQIGLTATPRTFDYGGRSPRDIDPEDEHLRRDNINYFGQPVYEYGIAEAIDDGYLAAMRLVDFEVVTAGTVERDEGVSRKNLTGAVVRDATTGARSQLSNLREHYVAGTLAKAIELPDRVKATAAGLFSQLIGSGGPHQKTLIFCASDTHADHVALELNNLYANWCELNGLPRTAAYAFKCTARGGRHLLADLRGSTARAFVSCTVDLISTGVDIPCLQNIVFFRYLKSAILFHQMLGRGTRIHAATNKLHFTAYDYTNATRLLDAPLVQMAHEHEQGGGKQEDQELEVVYEVSGVSVQIAKGLARIALYRDGRLEFLSIDEYRSRIAEQLLSEVSALEEFRNRWIDPPERGTLIESLPEHGASVEILQAATQQHEYDHFDILAQVGWDQTPRTRTERAERYEARESVGNLSPIHKALARQFRYGGVEALESPSLSSVPVIRAAGGLQALGKAEEMSALKRRIFAIDIEWR